MEFATGLITGVVVGAGLVAVVWAAAFMDGRQG
jgi:hypothetical protein